MTKDQLVMGAFYIAKVSGKLTVVKLICPEPNMTGYMAENCITHRRIHINTAGKLRRIVPNNLVDEMVEIYTPRADS